MNESQDNALQSVTIYKPHTHAGKRLRPGPDGIEIKVNVHEARFLKEAGVLDKHQVASAATRPRRTRQKLGVPKNAASAGPLTPRGATRPQG